MLLQLLMPAPKTRSKTSGALMAEPLLLLLFNNQSYGPTTKPNYPSTVRGTGSSYATVCHSSSSSNATNTDDTCSRETFCRTDCRLHHYYHRTRSRCIVFLGTEDQLGNTSN